MYKVGDLVYIIKITYDDGTPMRSNLVGKFARIVGYVDTNSIENYWKYLTRVVDSGYQGNLYLNDSDVIPANVAKLPIYKALTEIGDSGSI